MKRALVIDDDPMVRSVVRRALESDGYGVVEAADGKEGLAVLDAEPVDVVLTDILMPGMDGIELLPEIRRVAPRVPVIAMSGGGAFPAGTVLGPATALGATGVLMKPFSIDELRAQLAEVEQDQDMEMSA